MLKKILICSVLLVPALGATVEADYSDQVKPLLVQARSASTDQQRIIATKELSEVIGHMEAKSRNGLPPELIDDLCALLQDRSDAVRLYAAIALGNIGPRASPAIPALRDALKRAKVPAGQLGPDLGSDAAIPIAIDKIQGKTSKESAGGPG